MEIIGFSEKFSLQKFPTLWYVTQVSNIVDMIL